MEFKLHPVNHVLAGLILYPLEDIQNVASFVDSYVDSYMEEAPNELSIWMFVRRVPDFSILPEKLHGRHVVVIAICYSGPITQ